MKRLHHSPKGTAAVLGVSLKIAHDWMLGGANTVCEALCPWSSMPITMSLAYASPCHGTTVTATN